MDGFSDYNKFETFEALPEPQAAEVTWFSRLFQLFDPPVLLMTHMFGCLSHITLVGSWKCGRFFVHFLFGVGLGKCWQVWKSKLWWTTDNTNSIGAFSAVDVARIMTLPFCLGWGLSYTMQYACSPNHPLNTKIKAPVLVAQCLYLAHSLSFQTLANSSIVSGGKYADWMNIPSSHSDYSH